MNVRVETDWVHIHHDGVLFQVGFSASDHIILTTSRNGAPRNLYILDPDSHEFEVAESEPAAPDATEARFSPAPQPRPEGKESPYAIVYGHSVEIFCGDMVIKFLFTPDLGVLMTLSRGLDRPRPAITPLGRTQANSNSPTPPGRTSASATTVPTAGLAILGTPPMDLVAHEGLILVRRGLRIRTRQSQGEKSL